MSVIRKKMHDVYAPDDLFGQVSTEAHAMFQIIPEERSNVHRTFEISKELERRKGMKEQAPIESH